MKRVLVRIVLGIVAVVILAAGYAGYKFYWMGIVSNGARIEASSDRVPALLVIDIQEGITGAGSIAKGMAAQSEPLIATVNRVIGEADKLKMPVIYIRQENDDPLFNAIFLNSYLVAGTPPTATDKRVSVINQNDFVKHRMDAFSNPALDAFLRERKINHLYVTGLDAAACVDRTIKGALGRGYTVAVIRDGIISSTAEKRDAMIALYEKEGVSILSSDTWLLSSTK